MQQKGSPAVESGPTSASADYDDDAPLDIGAAELEPPSELPSASGRPNDDDDEGDSSALLPSDCDAAAPATPSTSSGTGSRADGRPGQSPPTDQEPGVVSGGATAAGAALQTALDPEQQQQAQAAIALIRAYVRTAAEEAQRAKQPAADAATSNPAASGTANTAPAAAAAAVASANTAAPGVLREEAEEVAGPTSASGADAGPDAGAGGATTARKRMTPEQQLVAGCRLVRALGASKPAAARLVEGGATQLLAIVARAANTPDVCRAAAFDALAVLSSSSSIAGATAAAGGQLLFASMQFLKRWVLQPVPAATATRKAGAPEPLPPSGPASAGAGSAAAAAAAAAAAVGGASGLQAACALRLLLALVPYVQGLAPAVQARLVASLGEVAEDAREEPALQRGALRVLAKLAVLPKMARRMLDAGSHHMACRLMVGGRSPALRASCCDMLAALASAGREVQEAMVLPLQAPQAQQAAGGATKAAPGGAAAAAAGSTLPLGKALARMVVVRNLDVMGAAFDAIANLTLSGSKVCQGAVSDAVPAMAAALRSNQPMLMLQAARALGNACMGHTGNQAAALQARALESVLPWLSSREPALVRAGLGVTANLVYCNEKAAAAAMSTGLVQPLMRLLASPVTVQASQGLAAAASPAAAAAAAPASASADLPSAESATSPQTQQGADSTDQPAASAADGGDNATAAAAGSSPEAAAQGGGGQHCGAGASADITPGAGTCGHSQHQHQHHQPHHEDGTPCSNGACSHHQHHHHHHHQDSTTTTAIISSEPAGAAAPAAPLPLRVAAEVYERAVTLLSNLMGCSRDMRDRMVKDAAPGLPHLLVAQLNAAPTPGVAYALCGALSNAVAGDGELQAAAAFGGGLQVLVHMVMRAPNANVVRRACYCLGTLVNGQLGIACAVVEAPGLAERLAALLAMRAPPLCVDVARVCGQLSARGNAHAQQRLGEAGVMKGLVGSLRLNHVNCVCGCLMACAGLMGACPANQRAFLAAGGAAELQRLLRVRGEDVVGRAAYCCWAAAEGCPEAQAQLVAAGVLPPLVRCLRSASPDLLVRGVTALQALVRGSRANAVAVAAAGGIPPLAALIEAAAEPHPGLWRRCVDLWLDLGGPPALVHLLSHKSPAVVERAAVLVTQIADGPDEVAKQKLAKAKVAAGILKAAKHRHAKVAEAALGAVAALARGGDDGGLMRGQLVDAGALGVLQALMGHKRVAVARLAAQVAQAMCVKPGASVP